MVVKLLKMMLGMMAAAPLLAGASAAAAAQFGPSAAQFDALFPNRIAFYTHAGLLRAVASFPAFAGTPDAALNRREMAAFLANVAHESDELRAVREYDPANYDKYCRTDPGESCAPGRQYYGRGPIQLSWNFQYLAAGKALGIDLWSQPDLVASDPTIAWQTALWYWMTQIGPGTMSPHDAMVSGAGFGETIRSINGALECGKPGDANAAAQVARRIQFYRRAAALFDVDPGERLGC
jgi:predicted chitinase